LGGAAWVIVASERKNAVDILVIQFMATRLSGDPIFPSELSLKSEVRDRVPF